MQELLGKVKQELRLRNYSLKTIQSYLFCLREYFAYKRGDLAQLNINNIKDFLLKKQSQGYAPQTVNLFLNAIKFFYHDIVKTNQPIGLKFATRSVKLPIGLSREEIKKIIESITNAKH